MKEQKTLEDLKNAAIKYCINQFENGVDVDSEQAIADLTLGLLGLGTVEELTPAIGFAMEAVEEME